MEIYKGMELLLLYVRRSAIIARINGVYGTSPLRLLFPAQLEQLIKIHSDLLQNMKLNDEEEIGTIFLHFLGSQPVGTSYRRTKAACIHHQLL